MATAGSWVSLRGVSLHPSLTNALTKSLSFPCMTPVQAAAIPPLLSSKDACVDAETGSGKTLSYLVPIAQTLLFTLRARPSSAVRALVLLPTRELAAQVHAVSVQLFDALPGGLTPAPLIGGGGADAAPSTAARADLRLVIATPGRLAAALAQGALNVGKLEVLILDEADRLLDMGFSVTLTDILTRLPRQRRTGIYSATQTAEVEALARAGLRNPVRVAVRVALRDGDAGGTPAKRQRVPASLQCRYHVVSPRGKLAHLIRLLAANPGHKFIVYFLTCACVDYYRRLPLAEMLESVAELRDSGAESEPSPKAARPVCALHGKMSQARREKSLAQFADSENGILLCTDVVARGIDIPDVDWVVQFDPPQDPDAYIHRVGRTARLGREGNALIYLAPSEDTYAEFLQVRRCPVAEFEMAADKLPASNVLNEMIQEKVLEATLADRAVLEASESAFLSYIRAYKEHRCRYLLKLEEVDVNSVADSFGLLRLPRFHEFKRLRANIVPRKGEGISIRDIAFKDKARERRRQQQIREAIQNRAERREALHAKSKKKGKKKNRKKDVKVRADAGKGQKREVVDEEENEDDFSAEAMQLRKVKRGKLSHAAFDEAIGYDALVDR